MLAARLRGDRRVKPLQVLLLLVVEQCFDGVQGALICILQPPHLPADGMFFSWVSKVVT